MTGRQPVGLSRISATSNVAVLVAVLASLAVVLAVIGGLPGSDPRAGNQQPSTGVATPEGMEPSERSQRIKEMEKFR